jgi:hypothetical protein
MDFFKKESAKIFSAIDKSVRKKIASDTSIPAPEKDAKTKSEQDEIKSRVEGEIRPVLVEISPLCDYAQGEVVYHRTIAGFLIENYSDCAYSGSSQSLAATTTPPFHLKDSSKNFTLFLNFRGLSTHEGESFNNKSPIFRLRQELLVDLQHKAGSHFSRPGITSINPR